MKRLAAVTSVLLLLLVPGAGARAAAPTATGSAAGPIWAIQLAWSPAVLAPTFPADLTVWPESTFTQLAARGIHYAEINMDWSAVEPSHGQFTFQTLSLDLAHAAQAHVRIYFGG